MWTVAGCLDRGRVVLRIAADVLTFLKTSLRSEAALAAENRFLITGAQSHVILRHLALQDWRQLHPLIERERREGLYPGTLPALRRGPRTNGAGLANIAPKAPNLSVAPSALSVVLVAHARWM
jgi:hypothetical protein